MSCASDLILSVPFARPALGDLPLPFTGQSWCVRVLSLLFMLPSPHMFGLGHRYLLPSGVEGEEVRSRLMPDSRFLKRLFELVPEYLDARYPSCGQLSGSGGPSTCYTPQQKNKL